MYRQSFFFFFKFGIHVFKIFCETKEEKRLMEKCHLIEPRMYTVLWRMRILQSEMLGLKN